MRRSQKELKKIKTTNNKESQRHVCGRAFIPKNALRY